ncbi:RAMP superfamily CRISPR-associated protein [Campylobacter hyointestinalis]|uniref:RAMP superfamily CRISPR-associated protein n=1 Tax=Campylobacter hyointestinalis TaxID=198 RepID=UPI0011AD5D85|nr:RAMP superfamily CRISPR-associated protein [Campylobacter hyointestinalis]TWO22397.1 CRISPR-associated protein [Campylobacter hyointestinalis]
MTTKRHIAHITLEALTPLKAGSQSVDFLQDSPVQKDWNNLPMILGSSIAGALRAKFQNKFKDKTSDIFGEENGSKIIISNALLLDKTAKVCETLLLEKDDFLRLFENLPLREHTAIDEKGVTINGAKFNEEVVFKGSRFKFSIELVEDDKTSFYDILSMFGDDDFKLGGGASKGFGEFKIIDIRYGHLDTSEYNSSLNFELKNRYQIQNKTDQSLTKYEINISPDNFFIFGSGFGDFEVDMTPVFEQTISYDTGSISNPKVLIPASSIKGALLHRTLYHICKLEGITADNGLKEALNRAKPLIVPLFGEAKDTDKNSKKGDILISDCFKANNATTKIFDHVAIDRFTGGAMDKMLFQEKTIAKDNDTYHIKISIKNEQEKDKKLIKAFENTLLDVTLGRLPLGGATTKGHGVFSGKVLKNGIELKDGK